MNYLTMASLIKWLICHSPAKNPVAQIQYIAAYPFRCTKKWRKKKYVKKSYQIGGWDLLVEE